MMNDLEDSSRTERKGNNSTQEETCPQMFMWHFVIIFYGHWTMTCKWKFYFSPTLSRHTASLLVSLAVVILSPLVHVCSFICRLLLFKQYSTPLKSLKNMWKCDCVQFFYSFWRSLFKIYFLVRHENMYVVVKSENSQCVPSSFGG